MTLKPDPNGDLTGSRFTYRLAFLVALLIYTMLHWQGLGDLFTYLTLPDNDDAMRLVQVQDLLAGQGWFDMVQHRAMPPDGLSLHWSRLVDLPLAGLTLFFQQFTAPDRALALTAALWPALLFVAYLAIVGRVASRVFGTIAASFAVVAAAATPGLSFSIFPPGRVDHHSVQVICMALVISALILPGRPVLRGVMGGLVAAVSLAVGLETIVVLALAGVVLTVQHVLDHPGATDRLVGYGIALGGAAPLLFMIQTDPALWAVPRCDQLSPPVLGITSAAMAFALITYLSRETVRSKRARGAMAAVMIVAILAGLWPMLSPCREGPFSMLPPEVRHLILSRITESLSVVRMFERNPGFATQLVLPLALVSALLIWQLIGSARGARSAVSVLLVFTLLGLAGLFYQIRVMIWGLAVLPLGFGAAMAWAVGRDWGGWRWAKAALLPVVGILVIYPHVFTQSPLFAAALIGENQPVNGKLASADQNCSRRDKFDGLQDIEPMAVLAPLNLGTKILLYTPHSIFAAPYHRAPEAYWNGTLAFSGSDMDMARRLRTTRADYVLVCDGEVYGKADSIGSRLARGEVPAWLQPVDTGGGPIRLMRVDRARLAPFVNGS
ncbi:hypothetical protein [Thalassovita mangrovi]|uniref:Glycosyltransferase RgtA/B/C/D-like domain-containing protein n=1 Tax=Thalassovita mangrovi TaxID=2692236 RepID=A0A6L8LHE2_9RHOB|nr:hypothetical protein [Thalassovita mangrovi]MYM55437.1 hypothetical protein [Thalassovita mangrovi]